jgi:DNA-binding transcriptional MerR regulator
MVSGRVKRWPHKNKPKPATTPVVPPTRDLKIGEAARLLGVEAYVLRFWETQFPFLRPKQTASRHRHYGQTDVETLKVIKRLLYSEGFTIAGARKLIRAKGIELLRGPVNATRKDSPLSTEPLNSELDTHTNDHIATGQNGKLIHALREIRDDLRTLHELLSTHTGRA